MNYSFKLYIVDDDPFCNNLLEYVRADERLIRIFQIKNVYDEIQESTLPEFIENVPTLVIETNESINYIEDADMIIKWTMLNMDNINSILGIDPTTEETYKGAASRGSNINDRRLTPANIGRAGKWSSIRHGPNKKFSPSFKTNNLPTANNIKRGERISKMMTVTVPKNGNNSASTSQAMRDYEQRKKRIDDKFNAAPPHR